METIVVAMGIATGLCVALLVYAVWQCIQQLDKAPECESEPQEANEK